jgi:hypothetical protein
MTVMYSYLPGQKKEPGPLSVPHFQGGPMRLPGLILMLLCLCLCLFKASGC